MRKRKGPAQGSQAGPFTFRLAILGEFGYRVSDGLRFCGGAHPERNEMVDTTASEKKQAPSEVLPDCMMPDGGETCQGYLNQFGENMNMRRRLRRIEAIIEHVDNRCMAADGPVTPTLQEMTQAELSQIYALARGRDV